MKQFLRLLLAAGVLAFAVSMTAVSCGKTPDAGGGNNNNNNNSGDGNGNGNSGPPAPAIAFQNFDAGAKLVAGGVGGATDTIRIKASAFPTVNADNNIVGNITHFWDAPAGSLKRIFDITITGGNAGAATGGLIMVGGGNVGNITNFSDPSGGAGGAGTLAQKKEGGYISGQADTLVQHVYRHSGWNHYGAFKNSTAPTAADPNASPFSFSSVPGEDALPAMFCRTTLPGITSSSTALSGGIKVSTTFAGGQTAHCYIGVSGLRTFTTARQTTWLNTAASATFKKTFNIAIGGIRTDAKTVKDFMPGATDDAKVFALNDGLNGADITEIIKTNPYAYRKVSVTIVSDAGF